MTPTKTEEVQSDNETVTPSAEVLTPQANESREQTGLLPCPFCGVVPHAGNDELGAYVVHSNAACPIAGEKYHVEVWNKRASNKASLVQELAIAREALKQIATPSLGGKIQQYTAIGALAEMASLIPSAPPAAQGPSAGAKPEDPSASPTKQQAELQEIARALEPFARFGDVFNTEPYCHEYSDEIRLSDVLGPFAKVIHYHNYITLGDCRRAKKALSALSAVSSKEEEKGRVGETGTLGQQREETGDARVSWEHDQTLNSAREMAEAFRETRQILAGVLAVEDGAINRRRCDCLSKDPEFGSCDFCKARDVLAQWEPQTPDAHHNAVGSSVPPSGNPPCQRTQVVERQGEKTL